MTNKVKEQIMAVRKSGKINMFDIHGVQYAANEIEFYDMVVYLEEKKEEYLGFTFTGEAPMEDSGQPC